MSIWLDQQLAQEHQEPEIWGLLSIEKKNCGTKQMPVATKPCAVKEAYILADTRG